MKRIISFLFFALALNIAKSQNIGYSWSHCVYSGMGSNSSTWSIYDDMQGNVYIGTFVFQSTFSYWITKRDLATGNQFFNIEAVIDYGNYEVTSETIRSDNNNNVFLCGALSGSGNSSPDFDPSFSSYTLNVTGPSNFIAKYSSTGGFLFASLTNEHINDMAFDSQGNIYTVGTFSGTVDFDWKAGTTNLTSIGSNDIFIAKYSSIGNLIRVKNIGSSNDESGLKIINDGSDKFIVAGSFSTTPVDFDPGPSTYNLVSAGANDIFYARYDSTFKFNWAYAIGGTGTDYLMKMTREINKIQLVTEYNSPSMDVDLSASVLNLTSSGPFKFGLISYDTSRVIQFGYSLDFNSFYPNGFVQDLALNSNGNLAAAGNFTANFDADPGPGVATMTLTAYTGTYMPPPADWWFGVYNSTGYKKAYCFGKLTGTSNMADRISINNNDEIVVGGNVCGFQMDYDPGPGLATWCNSSSGFTYGSFAAKYGYCTVAPSGTIGAISGPTLACANTAFVIQTYSISPVAGASNYSWTASTSFTGNPTSNSYDIYYYGGSGTLQVQPYNACGTSTTIQTLSITVNPQPTVTAITSNTLICSGQTANLTAIGANTFSWSTSASGSVIAVSPTVTTNYSVTGTNSFGCTNSSTLTQSVSACTGVSSLSSQQNTIQIFPNPFNDKINIAMWSPLDFSFQIFNSLGVQIYSGRMEKGKTEVDLSNQSSGIYFIKAGSFTKKMVKE